jgi:hypothetical protein
MQVYEPQDVLLAGYNVPLQYDEAAIQSVLDELVPHRARLLWSSREFAVGSNLGLLMSSIEKVFFGFQSQGTMTSIRK